MFSSYTQYPRLSSHYLSAGLFVCQKHAFPQNKNRTQCLNKFKQKSGSNKHLQQARICISVSTLTLHNPEHSIVFIAIIRVKQTKHNKLESMLSPCKIVPEHTGLVLPNTSKIFGLVFCYCCWGRVFVFLLWR